MMHQEIVILSLVKSYYHIKVIGLQDVGMFFWHKKVELLGMLIMYVDDLIW